MLYDDRVPGPSNRAADYFNVGDKIAVALKGKWYFGEVREGYRHHDGCVTYKLKGIGPDENDKNFEGYWGCGFAIPNLLKIEEFDFFQGKSDIYVKWYEEALQHNYGHGWEFNPINKEDLAYYAKSMLSV